MDTVSQNLFRAFTIQPQMSCENICNEMQNLMNRYQELNGNLENIIMTITLHKVTDHDSLSSSPPLIEYSK
jgi:hypothetical protein